MTRQCEETPSRLLLENGLSFPGYSPSWQDNTYFGEVVFTTGMTGYPESLTDPSYAGQLLTFTYPLIGNYGIPTPDKWESIKIHAAGVVVDHAALQWSHETGTTSLLEWLNSQNVPIIWGIDTRTLTKLIREEGTPLGAITTKEQLDFPKHEKKHFVAQVSRKETTISNPDKPKKVIAIDCGMKRSISHFLDKLPISLKYVPHDYDFTNEEYDGLFLSNGPGDPTTCQKTIDHLKVAMGKNKPIFGICLGTQLMALAAGASTYKLPYGHRGHNQPCMNRETKRCYITSQNHGYAVDKDSLPNEWEITFENLNDGSIEGIAHKTKPFFAVQFHPEANPGPTDTTWLFEKFYELL